MISLVHIELGTEEEELLVETVRSGKLSQGPLVARFEESFRNVSGTAHVVAVSSGTTALVAALQALGIGEGDEVITTPFTFVATIAAILSVGATVRLVDIHERDYTLDPQAMERAVNSRTAAILPVHLYGCPADMDAIAGVARANELTIVEDCAQAHGALVRDKPVGSFGVGCFSFYATKNITTGEGGAVTTDDDLIADRVRLLRNQGMRNRYEYELVGHNYRLTELQAAIGLPQLGRIDDLTRRRRDNAELLTQGLSDLPGLLVPHAPAGRTHVFHQYTVETTSDGYMDRDSLARGLADLGVETAVYYPRLVNDYDCFRDHPLVISQPTPRAVLASRQVLSLPVHPWLSRADIDFIIGSIRTMLIP